MQRFGSRSAPQGKLVTVIDTIDGCEKKIRLRKSVPKKCSRPRRICIKCLSSVIHPNSKFFDSKICEGCSS